MAATWGPYVHCELLIGTGPRYRAYSAYEGVGGLLPSRYTSGYGRDWTVVAFSLRDEADRGRLHSWALSLLADNIPYNSSDLWQCCVKILLPFESDLPYQHPEQWSSAFCSQLCLLFMRRLVAEGMVRGVPPSSAALIRTCNSRGCSPNQLFSILVPAGATEKKSYETHVAPRSLRLQPSQSS